MPVISPTRIPHAPPPRHTHRARLLAGVVALGVAACRPAPAPVAATAYPAARLLETRATLGVPTVDLAPDTTLPVVVDREPGQYLGHPTTVLLEDGRTMLVAYPRGHGAGAIMLRRSPDAGRSWSAPLPVPENWATSKETPTIHRVVGPDGRKRLVLFSGLYPIRMAHSEDDGATWTPLAPIGDYGGIVAMGSVVRVADGDYLAFFHDDGRFFRNAGGRSGRFTVYTVRSRDGGLTWGAPVAIASHPTLNLCEPGVFRSPDGRQLVALLRENGRTAPSQRIVSTDEGVTWSAPVPLPLALTGDRHVAVRLRDGRYLVSFRDMAPESPTKGDWVAWLGTFDELTRPAPGGYRVRLMDNTNAWDSTYPGVELLPDGRVVLTTYGHWTAGQQPWIASITLDVPRLERTRAAVGVAP
jgi:hypothetical protein